MSSGRTDMAAEFIENFAELPKKEVDIIQNVKNGCKYTHVRIKSETAATIIGKPVGEYSTVETPSLLGQGGESEGEFAALKSLLGGYLPTSGTVLVIGLGNMNITPDALGPQVAEKLLATRHMATGGELGIDLRSVAVLAPGVLGQTGMESGEVAKAIVTEIAPAAIVAVDAYATSSYKRLGCTVQISNSGVVPGSGVLNARKELSERTMGVPVIAIGVPTVVEANLQDDDSGERQNLLVTPRDIDVIIKRAAVLLSSVINSCLQTDLSDEEINFLLGEI